MTYNRKGDSEMKRFIAFFLCMLMLFAFAACNKDEEAGNKTNNEPTQAEKNDAIVLPDVVKGSITFKDYGMVNFEIYPNLARQSCLNFIYLVNSGHYNGVIVDRLVKGFVIQAGQYQSGFVPRNTEFEYTIKGEFEKNGVENNLSFIKGTMAWVLKGDDMNSAHTEFAIYTDSTTCWDLQGKYAAFGMITGEDSFKVLKKINKQKTYAERPSEEITITSVTLEPIAQEGFAKDFEFPEPNFIMVESKSDEAKKKD